MPVTRLKIMKLNFWKKKIIITKTFSSSEDKSFHIIHITWRLTALLCVWSVFSSLWLLNCMNTARPLSWAVHVVKYVTMADADVSSAISRKACKNKRVNWLLQIRQTIYFIYLNCKYNNLQRIYKHRSCTGRSSSLDNLSSTTETVKC